MTLGKELAEVVTRARVQAEANAEFVAAKFLAGVTRPSLQNRVTDEPVQSTAWCQRRRRARPTSTHGQFGRRARQSQSPHTEDHHRCAPTLPSRPVILESVSARLVPGQVPLPSGLCPNRRAAHQPMADEPASERPRRGRPRIWASEAERKRAYRERLAADYAEPERLRRELRIERKWTADRNRKLARLEQQLGQAQAKPASSRSGRPGSRPPSRSSRGGSSSGNRRLSGPKDSSREERERAQSHGPGPRSHPARVRGHARSCASRRLRSFRRSRRDDAPTSGWPLRARANFDPP